MTELSFACRHRFETGFELDVEFAAQHPVTSLFGPSGSGKTTILSILAGILNPDHGRVEIGGHVVLDTDTGLCLPPEKRLIGKVFQDHLLFPHLTVASNLRFGMRRAGATPSILFSRVVEVLELGELLERQPNTLSGGQRQRVALGRALLSGPRLLVLDEPLAALDQALKVRILDYLERVVQEWKIPTLFVSHGAADVHRLADHVLVLDRGRIVASGTPEHALGQAHVLGWTKATGPANLLRVTGLTIEGGRRQGLIADQAIYLPDALEPRLENASASAIYVQCSPTDVVLSLDLVERVSARNCLVGTVDHLVESRGRVFVAIDLGQTLWVEVTPESATNLSLAPGLRVVCMIKTSSLEIVGVGHEEGGSLDSSGRENVP